MQIDINVDLSRQAQQTLGIEMTYRNATPQTELILPALSVENGIQVNNLRITDTEGPPLAFESNQDRLLVNAPHFHVTYDIQTRYTHCVGSDRTHDFTYPFINAEEIFWGSGTLAYPANLAEVVSTARLSFKIQNLPPGWKMFSNIIDDKIHAGMLDGFFVYCSQDQIPQTYTHGGQPNAIIFRWLIQREKAIPISADDIQAFLALYFGWLEKHLGPLRMRDIQFLVLQAPENFQELAAEQSFASGENVINGIVAYSPQSPAYLRSRFGHGDYTQFLLEGLAHELMHFYTTASWQGRFKSRLYAAPNCTRAHACMIGEGLNLYFCMQFVGHYLGEWEIFWPQMLARALRGHLKTGQRSSLLDLFLLDIALRHGSGDLLRVFGALTREQQSASQPYASAQILLNASARLGYALPPDYPALLLDENVPDYQTLLHDALNEIGYTLDVTTDSHVSIEKTHAGQIEYNIHELRITDHVGFH